MEYVVADGVSVDTIKIITEARDIGVAEFTRAFATTELSGEGGQRHKLMRVPSDSEEHHPVLTYYPQQNNLVLQASMSKIAMGHNQKALSEAKRDGVVEWIDWWLGETGLSSLPSVVEWKALRVDYAANWFVGKELPFYMRGLQQLNLPRHQRSTFGNDGVRWTSNARTVQFYDKSKESGLAAGLLRFEVQNTEALRYMQERWWVRGRCLGAWLTEDVATHTLGYWLYELRAHDVLGGDANMAVLKDIFPTMWPQAATYLKLMQQHGGGVVAHGYMTRSTYQRYKKLFVEHQLLSSDDGHKNTLLLPALRLPLTKNLKNFFSPPINVNKRFPKNFGTIVERVCVER
jgi:hypothetical protein